METTRADDHRLEAHQRRAQLSNIDEVPQLQDDDLDCLDEVRLVLERHGKVSRFGVALLHSHFEMDEEEILVETVDVESRTLTVQPMRRDEVGAAVDTIWRLDGATATQKCWQTCRQIRDLDGSFYHMPAHRHPNG